MAQVKICGLRNRGDLAAAAAAGAAWGGLVFYPPSPRHVTLADARWIAVARPEGLPLVALTVDATDAEIAERWVIAMRGKRAGHGIDDVSFLQPDRPMSAIGG